MGGLQFEEGIITFPPLRMSVEKLCFIQYVAVKGERVIGVVVKTGRVHRVDIGTALLASLPELAFQGATRRNKPSLQVYYTQ